MSATAIAGFESVADVEKAQKSAAKNNDFAKIAELEAVKVNLRKQEAVAPLLIKYEETLQVLANLREQIKKGGGIVPTGTGGTAPIYQGIRSWLLSNPASTLKQIVAALGETYTEDKIKAHLKSASKHYTLDGDKYSVAGK